MINEISLELGTKEKERKVLGAVEVEIVKYDITDVGQNKKKVIFEIKHPESEKTIQVSKAKYEKDGKLEIAGTWLSLDEEGKISKYSSLAHVMRNYKVTKLEDLKKVKLAYDESKYLVIKAYD